MLLNKRQLIDYAHLLKHQNRNEFERIYPTIAIAGRFAGAISYIVITIVGPAWMNPLSTAQPITQWLVHTIEFSHNTQSWQYWHVQFSNAVLGTIVGKEWNIILFPTQILIGYIQKNSFLFQKPNVYFLVGFWTKNKFFSILWILSWCN